VKTLTFKEADELFLMHALEWHDNPIVNKGVGSEKGEAGIFKAKAILKRLVIDKPPFTKTLGVWFEDQPVAYVVFSDINPMHKRASLHITVNPKYFGKGFGEQSVAQALSLGFNEGLFRIDFCPIKHNKRAVNLAKRLGFTLECYSKSSFWIGTTPVDQAQFRMLRSEWSSDS